MFRIIEPVRSWLQAMFPASGPHAPPPEKTGKAYEREWRRRQMEALREAKALQEAQQNRGPDHSQSQPH